MTAIHVSSFDREKRRKIAKDAIVKVREQGIRKSHIKLLQACLFGLAKQTRCHNWWHWMNPF